MSISSGLGMLNKVMRWMVIMMVGVFRQPQMYIVNEIVDGRNAKGQLWWGRQILKRDQCKR